MIASLEWCGRPLTLWHSCGSDAFRGLAKADVARTGYDIFRFGFFALPPFPLESSSAPFDSAGLRHPRPIVRSLRLIVGAKNTAPSVNPLPSRLSDFPPLSHTLSPRHFPAPHFPNLALQIVLGEHKPTPRRFEQFQPFRDGSCLAFSFFLMKRRSISKHARRVPLHMSSTGR